MYSALTALFADSRKDSQLWGFSRPPAGGEDEIPCCGPKKQEEPEANTCKRQQQQQQEYKKEVTSNFILSLWKFRRCLHWVTLSKTAC